MKFIDLFAGIGGFRLALEGLGLECVFSSEIDKNEYNIPKNWENLFRYLNTKKLLNGKVVCGISLIDDVRNLNLNQDMFRYNSFKKTLYRIKF